MTNAINARAVVANDRMTIVMAVCKVGIVTILKANFILNCVGEDERGLGGGVQ